MGCKHKHRKRLDFRRLGRVLFACSVLVLAFVFLAFAQKETGRIVFLSAGKPIGHRDIAFKSPPTDSLLAGFLQTETERLLDEGFLDAHPVGYQKTDSGWQLSIEKGGAYFWGELDAQGDSLPPGFESFTKPQGVFSLKKLTALLDGKIKELADGGYPFAAYRIEEIALSAHKVSVRLFFSLGERFVFDVIGLKFSKGAFVRQKFLSKELGIRPGKPFSQKIFEGIEEKLAAMPYLSLIKPAELYFDEGKAQVFLGLEKKNTNEFDGFLLFGRASPQLGVQVNGQLKILIDNLLGTGKKLTADFRKIEKASQSLDLKYHHPGFLGQPFDLSAAVAIWKQDSSFVNAVRQLSATSKGIARKALFGLGTESSTVLPRVGTEGKSVSYSFLKLGFLLKKTGNADNSKPGHSLGLAVQYGRRNLVERSGSSTSGMIKIEGNGEKTTVIGKRVWNSASLNLRWAFSDKALLAAEGFRFGGTGFVRGFNQGEFSSPLVGIATNELYFGKRESVYFSVFGDLAFYSEAGRSSPGFLAGIGGGLGLALKSGRFNIVYGIGKRGKSPFSFSAPKIHFGFSAFF